MKTKPKPNPVEGPPSHFDETRHELVGGKCYLKSHGVHDLNRDYLRAFRAEVSRGNSDHQSTETVMLGQSTKRRNQHRVVNRHQTI